MNGIKATLIGILLILSLNAQAMEREKQPRLLSRDEIKNILFFSEHEQAAQRDTPVWTANTALSKEIPREIIATIKKYMAFNAEYVPASVGWVALGALRGYKFHEVLDDSVVLSHNLNSLRFVKVISYRSAMKGDDVLAVENKKCWPDVQLHLETGGITMRHDNDYEGITTRFCYPRPKDCVSRYDGVNVNNNGLYVLKYPSDEFTFCLINLNAPLFEPPVHDTSHDKLHRLVYASPRINGVVAAHALDYGSDSVLFCLNSASDSNRVCIGTFASPSTHDIKYETISWYNGNLPAKMKKCSFLTTTTALALSIVGQLYVMAVQKDGTIMNYLQQINHSDGTPMKLALYAVNSVQPSKLLLLSDRGTLYYTSLRRPSKIPGSHKDRFSLYKVAQLPYDAARIEQLWYTEHTFGYKLTEQQSSVVYEGGERVLKYKNDLFSCSFDVVSYSAYSAATMKEFVKAKTITQ